MNLSLLDIKNYKGITRLAIQFDNRPVVLTGRNGVGKTSALQALKFGLIGGNPGDLSKIEQLLRRGAKRGSVEIETRSGHKIERRINPHKLLVDDTDNGINEGQGEVCNIVRCPKRKIEFCLNPEKFVAKNSKDQRETIWEFLSLSITADIVEQMLRDHGLLKAYSRHFSKDISGDIEGPYSSFYNSRKEAGRTRKNTQAALDKIQEEVDAGSAPPPVPKPDESALKHASETLQGLSRLLGQKATLEAAQAKRERRLESLSASVGELPSWTREQAMERLKSLEEEYSKNHFWLREPVRLRGELERLKSDCCPSCKRAWDNLEEREAQRSQIEAQIKEAEEQAKAVQKIDERRLLGRKKIQEYDETLAARQEMTQLRREIAEFECPSVDEARLEEARQKFNELNQKWSQWQAYDSWKTRRESLRKELDTATKEYNELHELVNLFGPNGIKFQVISNQLAEVAEQINGTIGLWDMEIRWNGELELEICRDGVWRLLSGASDGERIMVSLAVQVWVSQETGLRTILLDRLEALDRENFQILLDGVCELMDHEVILHALIADTGYADNPIYQDRVQVVNLDQKLKGNKENG